MRKGNPHANTPPLNPVSDSAKDSQSAHGGGLELSQVLLAAPLIHGRTPLRTMPSFQGVIFEEVAESLVGLVELL